MPVFDTVPSPVGDLLVAAEDAGLTLIHFEQHRHPVAVDASWRHVGGARGPALDAIAAARSQLNEYFAGARRTFDLPLAAHGTPFQARVWTALRDIPFGAAVSYAELARRIGSPDAVRAVGAANGRNPLSIVVPCHRVIGADGSLTGFGGGIERKRWLLDHEGAAYGRADETLSLF